MLLKWHKKTCAQKNDWLVPSIRETGSNRLRCVFVFDRVGVSLCRPCAATRTSRLARPARRVSTVNSAHLLTVTPCFSRPGPCADTCSTPKNSSRHRLTSDHFNSSKKSWLPSTKMSQVKTRLIMRLWSHALTSVKQMSEKTGNCLLICTEVDKHKTPTDQNTKRSLLSFVTLVLTFDGS